MILNTFNKEVCLFRLGRNEQYCRAFIFDIRLIPQRPDPRRLVFQFGGGKQVRQWSMSWEKFKRQTAIGTIACINRSEFKYSFRRVVQRKQLSPARRWPSSPDRYAPCSHCEGYFKSEEDVVRHIRDFHGRQKCSKCGRSLRTCKDITGVGQAFVC